MLKLIHMCVFVVVGLSIICNAVAGRGSQSYCENGQCVLTEDEFDSVIRRAYEKGRAKEKEALSKRVQACQVVVRDAGDGLGPDEEYYEVPAWYLNMEAYKDSGIFEMHRFPTVVGETSQYYEIDLRVEAIRWMSKSSEILEEMFIEQVPGWSDKVGMDNSGVSIIEALRSGNLNAVTAGGHFVFPNADLCP